MSAKMESIFSKLQQFETMSGMAPMETEAESIMKEHLSKYSSLISDENDASYTRYEIDRNEAMLSYFSTQTHIDGKPRQTMVSVYGEYVSILKEAVGETTAKATQTSSGAAETSGASSSDGDENSEPASASAQPSGSGAGKVVAGLATVVGMFVGVLAAL